MSEHVRIFDDEVGEDFTVNFDMCNFELIDERAIGKSTEFDGLRNSGDPKPTEVAFLIFSSRECVFARMEICFLGHPDQSAFGHPVAFVGFEQFLVFGVAREPPGNSHSTLGIQKPFDDPRKPRRHEFLRFILPSLTGLTFSSSDVPRALRPVHDFAVFRDSESFRCYFFRFDFSHMIILPFCH